MGRKPGESMNYSPSPSPADAYPTDAHYEEALAQSSSSSSNGSSPHSPISHMVSQIPAMVYSWHIQHATGESSFSYVSDYCHDIFGISAEDAMGDSNLIVNMMVEEDVPGFSAAIVHSMKNLSLFDRQVRIKRPSDGERRTIHFQSRPRRGTTRNEDGEETRVTVWDGVITDVSRHTGHHFSNARQMESLVQEDTLVPRFSLDVTGKITEWNRLMVKTTGHARDAVLGKPIEEFVLAPDIPDFSAHVNDALRDPRHLPPTSETLKSIPERDFSFLAADGTNRQLRTQCKVTFDLNDEINGLVWACQDVTLLQEAQQEKDAATKLMRAERGLTEWLSHEMRNPLSVAMEALQTVQELTTRQVACAEDGYSTAECYQVMGESMNYVVDLLNNVMDLDQCAQGIVPIVSAPCNATHDILLPTYRMMKRAKRSGAVTLRLAPSLAVLAAELSSRDIMAETEDQSETGDIDGTPSLEDVVAHVDKLRLRQVLTNLIANAFHFTSTGFVEIDMHTREGAGASKTLSFHVRDSGCGVQPSEYDALFSRWEELGSSRNGTGIGLCLCQALIQAMGGSIRLNTEYKSDFEGQPGAEFIVELPIDAPQVSNAGDDMVGSAKQGVQPELPCSSLSSAVMASKPLLPGHNGTAGCGPVALTQRSNSNSYPRDFNHLAPSEKISRRASLGGNTLTNSLKDQMSLGAATAAAQNASVLAPSTAYSAALIAKNSYIRGHYRILIVDDEKMGRKFLRRRFSRLFPGSHVEEVASGEEALVEASKQQFDIITMDHFMAIDEMNGDETIRELRKVDIDATIIGISGNKKEEEHLEAGADMFFQKPLPKDTALLELFRGKLSPPTGWKVLVVSNDSSIATLLTDRLYRVASPHYTSPSEAVKRWNISTVPSVVSVKDVEGFDLVVMVQPTGISPATPDSVRQYLRYVFFLRRISRICFVCLETKMHALFSTL